MRVPLCAVLAVSTLAGAAAADVRITEFMSEGAGDTLSGNGGRRQREFFELTNIGDLPVNVSGWTYNDDNPNDPIAWGDAIGAIQPFESIVLTQMTEANFRAYWNLPLSVRVIYFGQLSNLGNADTINIYNSATQNAGTLVDSLSYTADARGSGVSRNRPVGGFGQYPNSQWLVSALGDSFQSHLAGTPGQFSPGFPGGGTGNPSDYVDLANPGSYIPTPGSMGLLLVGGLMASRRQRGR